MPRYAEGGQYDAIAMGLAVRHALPAHLGGDGLRRVRVGAWEQTTTWKASPKNVEEIQWAPVTAKQPGCESSKANRIRETARKISFARRPKDTIMPIDDDSVMWSWEEADGTKGAQFFRFLCLPDTVDPHGPKGK